MTDWTDIHEDFNKTYQKEWEQANITKQEAKEWIKAGFEPSDYSAVKKWKNLNFSPTETKTWLEVGLDKECDWEFASWLRTNYYTPELVKNNLEQLGSEYNPYFLTKHYPNHNIKILNISQKNLKGELNLRNYQQLEKLVCSSNKLTNIILPTNLTSLKYLNLSYNNFNRDLSFLVPYPYTNLEELYLHDNKFTGSLDYLSGMGKLKELWINDTDINEVQIDKLPRSLERIVYSTIERPDCKLTAIVPQLEEYGKYGRCQKCQNPNNVYKRCQPCAEQEWKQDLKQLSGQELINKLIEQQGKWSNGRDILPWIPYEQFTGIKHIADGGFSKIYKAKCKENAIKDAFNRNIDIIVLKSLNNSQNITLEFLTEIVNTKVVDGRDGIVKCHGISQNPTTKNYLMVMEYIEGGNLRHYLQNEGNKLSLEDKLNKLRGLAQGLYSIHQKDLVHQDFHSGNILNNNGNSLESFITDLGLSRPVNHLKEEGKIFGVLPYVAPEVLQGKPYTKKADIYSFGIIAYELLANAYPYPEMDNLAVAVCSGLRPNIDKVPLPQEIKDFIKNCWDSNPDQRPKVLELWKIIGSWTEEIREKNNTSFYHQYQEIKAEYNAFSQKSYQIHPTAITTSKVIDTKQITKELEKFYSSATSIDNSLELKFQNVPTSTQELTKRFRSLSMEEENKLEITKSVKLGKIVEELYSEPMEITENNSAKQINYLSNDWTNIHSDFNNQILVQSWQNLNFTYSQTQEWINIGLQPTDYNFCSWLRDNKHFTPEQVLNHYNLEQLNQEFFTWWQEQQTQIQIPPK